MNIMAEMMSLNTLLIGLLIFAARVTDVAMGTIRTISIVQGRTKAAFFLGFTEITLWLMVISTVLNKIQDSPLLALFYAAGFATGNVVGIRMERRLGIGNLIVRFISCEKGREIASQLRAEGYPVTTFQGEGLTGPVLENYVVCRRKDFKSIVESVRLIEPDAFYISESAAAVSRLYRPFMAQPTGWRAVLKKR